MKHDSKANWQTCVNTVADLTLTAWHGIVSNLVFGLEVLHHELGSQFLKELSGDSEVKFWFYPSKIHRIELDRSQVITTQVIWFICLMQFFEK